jgi:hypothetical protein
MDHPKVDDENATRLIQTQQAKVWLRQCIDHHDDAVSEGLMIQRRLGKADCLERCGSFGLYEVEDRGTFLKRAASTSLEGCICQTHDDGSAGHTIRLV